MLASRWPLPWISSVVGCREAEIGPTRTPHHHRQGPAPHQVWGDDDTWCVDEGAQCYGLVTVMIIFWSYWWRQVEKTVNTDQAAMLMEIGVQARVTRGLEIERWVNTINHMIQDWWPYC